MSDINAVIVLAIITFFAKYFTLFVFSIGIFQNLIAFLQLPAAWLELRKYSQAEDTESSWELLMSNMIVPISILVPAYNEAETIVSNIYSLLSLKYPAFDIIIINDGSSDETLACLIKEFSLTRVNRAHTPSIKHAPIKAVYSSRLYPQLLILDKVNAGSKGDAINAGINFSRNPLFCVTDADSLLEAESLLRAVRPFLEDPKHMIAVGGTIRIINGCKVKSGQISNIDLPTKFLPLVQVLEYIRAFLVARLAWSRWGILAIISGAFGIFNRQVALEVGGFSQDTVGEDLEMIIKMHKNFRTQNKNYVMRYVPEPVCWTEAPNNLHTLARQRIRWQKGALETFFKYRGMLFNKQYGKIGMLIFPYVLIMDVISPVLELIGYLLIPILWFYGLISTAFLLAFIALFFLFGIFISVTSLILEEMELRRYPQAKHLLILMFAAILENFGYRQLNNIWRIVGWWHFINKRKDWGIMQRTGFAEDINPEEKV